MTEVRRDALFQLLGAVEAAKNNGTTSLDIDGVLDGLRQAKRERKEHEPLPLWVVAAHQGSEFWAWPSWGDHPTVEEAQSFLVEELEVSEDDAHQAKIYWDGPFDPPPPDIAQEIREEMEDEKASDLMHLFRNRFREQCERFCEAVTSELESVKSVLERDDPAQDLELATESLKEKVDWLWAEAGAFKTVMELGEAEEEGDGDAN